MSQSELLEKLTRLEKQLEDKEKYPGISCSKPQEGGCFQNMFSARECPDGQLCSTVDAENKIFRCKTPSNQRVFKCTLLVVCIIFVIFVIFRALFPQWFTKKPKPSGGKG